MNFRKQISLLVTLILGLTLSGQICPKVETSEVPFLNKIEITSTNAAFFYKKAQQLITVYNRDSLFEACRILNHLSLFDSITYSKIFLASNFLKIEELNYNYLKSKILGKWKLKLSKSDWCSLPDSLTPINITLMFTDTLALLYQNETLAKKTKYRITNEFTSPYFKEINFQLFLIDSKDLWDFGFITNGENYPKALGINEVNVGLYISEIPDCIYNCPGKVYLKTTY